MSVIIEGDILSTRLRPRAATAPRDRGWWLYLALHWSGVLASTLLMSWGLFLLFFLAIGGFSLDGAMLHLDNFAGRYVTADAERVMRFKGVLATLQFVSFGVILFLRRSSLTPRDPNREVSSRG